MVLKLQQFFPKLSHSKQLSDLLVYVNACSVNYTSNNQSLQSAFYQSISHALSCLAS